MERKQLEIRSTEKFIKEIEQTIEIEAARLKPEVVELKSQQEINKKRQNERKEYITKVKEGIKLKSPFIDFQRERDGKTIERIVKAANMLEENVDLEEISKETGFTIEQINMIKRMNNPE